MTCGSEYAPGLRAARLPHNGTAVAILHVLHHSGAHLSPTEIYKKAHRDAAQLTEPTVYRTLEFLEKNGLAISSQVDNRKLVYRSPGENHDHLSCQWCGASFQVKPEALDEQLSCWRNRADIVLSIVHAEVLRHDVRSVKKPNLKKGD